MAKRGETRPWKVVYQYDGQREGRESFTSAHAAEAKADGIREWAERTDRVVIVRVEYVNPKGENAA